MEGSGSVPMRDGGLPYLRRICARSERLKRKQLVPRRTTASPLLLLAVFYLIVFLVPATVSPSPLPAQYSFSSVGVMGNSPPPPLPSPVPHHQDNKRPSAPRLPEPQPSNDSQPRTPPPRTGSVCSTKSKDRKCSNAPGQNPPLPPSSSPPPPSLPPPRLAPSPLPAPAKKHSKITSTVGWSFLGFAFLLQVALDGFLEYKRRELQRLGTAPQA